MLFRSAWGRVGYEAARRLMPEALGWFARAEGAVLSNEQLAWKVRAALRRRDWTTVRNAIDAMSPAEQQEPAWRYWKARALKAQGRVTEAHALFAPLVAGYHFYGQLAAEELGTRSLPPAALYKPTREEAQSTGRNPGLQRALAFYRMNLRFEGNREWNWTIRNFDDRQLLAAAEFARRSELYDRAINTADRTKELHDFSMSYLAPYRDVMKNYVAQQQLDEAWVYGLIWQESRFVPNIKSSAGATGLMQLMPATARWMARKLGLRDWHSGQVVQIGRAHV